MKRSRSSRFSLEIPTTGERQTSQPGQRNDSSPVSAGSRAILEARRAHDHRGERCAKPDALPLSRANSGGCGRVDGDESEGLPIGSQGHRRGCWRRRTASPSCCVATMAGARLIGQVTGVWALPVMCLRRHWAKISNGLAFGLRGQNGAGQTRVFITTRTVPAQEKEIWRAIR